MLRYLARLVGLRSAPEQANGHLLHRLGLTIRSPRGLVIAAGLVATIFAFTLAVKPDAVSRSESADVAAGDVASGDVPAPTDGFEQTPVDFSSDNSEQFASGIGEGVFHLAENETRASSKTATRLQARVAAIGQTGTVHEVHNADQWSAALSAARPGDTIRIASTINSRLFYRGSRAEGNRANAQSGTSELPITITAAPDVWIDPGDQRNRQPALDIRNAAHINVIGVNVRNSQFGIRIVNSVGSAESPMLIARNQITEIGHAGLHVIGRIDDRSPSQHIRIEENTISRTGRIAAEFGEGVYIGYGSQEWLDESSNVAIVNNKIFETGAEAIDLKPGTRNILVEGNQIHDLAPLRGGAISAHYVGGTVNPDLGTLDEVIIRRNRIWNINLDNTPGSNDWAIWVGHGGVTIEGNAIWGLDGNAGSTRAVRIRALYDFGPHPVIIRNNVFWTATGWASDLSPSPKSIVANGNQGPQGAKGVEVTARPDPAAPGIGQGGDADAGQGPGSAFGVWDTDSLP